MCFCCANLSCRSLALLRRLDFFWVCAFRSVGSGRGLQTDAVAQCKMRQPVVEQAIARQFHARVARLAIL